MEILIAVLITRIWTPSRFNYSLIYLFYSNHPIYGPAHYAVDGINDYTQGSFHAADNGIDAVSAWIAIDLGSPSIVYQIRMVGRTLSLVLERIGNFKVGNFLSIIVAAIKQLSLGIRVISLSSSVYVQLQLHPLEFPVLKHILIGFIPGVRIVCSIDA